MNKSAIFVLVIMLLGVFIASDKQQVEACSFSAQASTGSNSFTTTRLVKRREAL
jgi:hypothetical protein